MEKQTYFSTVEESIKANNSTRFIIVDGNYCYHIYDTDKESTFSSWHVEVCKCSDFDHASTIVLLLNNNEELGY